MKVKFGNKTYEVVNEVADLYVLEDGRVVAVKDCKPVKEAEPKAKKKAE